MSNTGTITMNDRASNGQGDGYDLETNKKKERGGNKETIPF